jgi:hypothetical protein
MCIAVKEFTNTGLYRAVYFDGPQPDLDQDGDGGQCGTHPVWEVYIGDDEAEPVSHLQHFRSFQIAEDVARHLASTKRLDLIHDASPA